MTLRILTVLALLAAPAAAAEPAGDPAGSPPPAGRALAASLVDEASPGDLPDDVPAFLRRAVVLTALAVRLDGDDARAWRVRAEAMDVLDDPAAAAEAEAHVLRIHQGRDYGAGSRLIRYRLAALDTAEQRSAMLEQAAADPAWSQALRALAVANLGAVAEGRGRMDEALALYRRALTLDPTEQAALRGVGRLAGESGAAHRVEVALGLLRGNPLAINVAWELGQICRDVGLHVEAVAFYDYAAAVARATGRSVSRVFMRDHLDALVDAGAWRRAADEFTDAFPGEITDVAMAGLLVEANRRLGDDGQVQEHLRRLQEAYGPNEGVARSNGAMAAEMAWYHLISRQRHRTALNWAVIALRAAPDDPLVQRVWAVTHLRSDQAERAREMLAELAANDLDAATALLDDAMLRGDRDAAARWLETAGTFSRRGAAWRRLMDVIARHNAAPPAAMAAADDVKARLDAFMAGPTLEMGRSPQAFLRVTVEPAAAEVRPGTDPAVVATLTNIGSAPVPIGQWGLLDPQAMLTVRMTAPEERRQWSQQVPVAWPAPRWLTAGESVRQVVSLNSGEIRTALSCRPLSRLELSIETLIEPVRRNDQMVSALPALSVAPTAIVRLPLVDTPTDEAYFEALAALVGSLRGDDPVEAMRAADVTVSLLALADKVRAGETGPAGKLGNHLQEPHLLAMLRHCLQEAHPAVRARTLGAMGDLEITPLMVQLITPCLRHASGTVRARALQRLAEFADGRPVAALTAFARQDPDPLVAEMARAMTGTPRRE
ncbi:MAG: hypothetical protein GX591_09455 [Planctomycetes bacterium]|nr:hypothetical protein [Planctomycetota bacterium]